MNSIGLRAGAAKDCKEDQAAEALRLVMGPDGMPPLPALQFAARQICAANSLCSDWYDIFQLPSGQLWLVVGDVAGHGARAAATMARTRAALRAYALLGGGPEKLMERLDAEVSTFEPETIVTALCASSKPPFGQFLISSAGHPPPIIAAAGTTPRSIEVVTEPPLGAAPGSRRSLGRFQLPKGALLFAYTGGLLRGGSKEPDEELERLRATVAAVDAEFVCSQVVELLVGDAPLADDIVIVALRRPSRGEKLRWLGPCAELPA